MRSFRILTTPWTICARRCGGALETGDFFDEEMRQKLDEMMAEGTLDELIDKLIERMEQENYISQQNGPRGSTQRTDRSGTARPEGENCALK